MEYTHKVAYNGEWWLCAKDGCELLYKDKHGICGSFKISIISIEKYYTEEEGYVVTKLRQFTGNT